MKSHFWTITILCSLIIIAVGAICSAMVNGPYLKIRHFEVITDAESSRIQPIIDHLDRYSGKPIYSVSIQKLQNDISEFKQVERVTISKQDLSGFKVEVKLRQPVLVVTNGIESICLGPEGIPFRNWPDHGEMPVFTIPRSISPNDLLEPDSTIQEFYLLALHIVSLQLENISDFSSLLKYDENELQLANQQTSMYLRLPRKILRDPASSLINVNRLIDDFHLSRLTNLELDARFPNTILIRSLKGVG